MGAYSKDDSWEILDSFRAESLPVKGPWWCFAQDKCLASWSEHFTRKNKPYVLLSKPLSKGGKIKQLWIQYRYDPGLGKSGNERGEIPKGIPVPRCIRKMK